MSTNNKITLNNGKDIVEKMKATQPEEYFAVLKEPVLFTKSEKEEKLFCQMVLGDKTESE